MVSALTVNLQLKGAEISMTHTTCAQTCEKCLLCNVCCFLLLWHCFFPLTRWLRKLPPFKWQIKILLMPEWVNSGCMYKNLIRLSPYFSVAEAVCCSQEWCESARLRPFIPFHWLSTVRFTTVILSLKLLVSDKHFKKIKTRVEKMYVLTLSPVGRCCWGPSCLAAGQTLGWLDHLRYLGWGREWGYVPLSGCFCSDCWQTGEIRIGGCAEGEEEVVVWTDCGGWQPLQVDRQKCYC